MEEQLVKKQKKNEYKNIKHNCSCGGIYSNRNKAKHKRTKKHQRYLHS